MVALVEREEGIDKLLPMNIKVNIEGRITM